MRISDCISDVSSYELELVEINAQKGPTKQTHDAPAAFIRASDLERLSKPYVAVCAASLSKEGGEGWHGFLLLALVLSSLMACVTFTQFILGSWRADEPFAFNLLFWTGSVMASSLGGLVVLKKLKSMPTNS